jgi:hypothetical protein
MLQVVAAALGVAALDPARHASGLVVGLISVVSFSADCPFGWRR